MAIIGVERLTETKEFDHLIGNACGILCHAASINRKFQHVVDLFHAKFPGRLKKIFGPQHGFVTDVQDNMVETKHSFHPVYQVPIFSLYGETRHPTEEMLQGLDTIIVDLQDVGTRVYTYISTLTYLLRTCQNRNLRVVILDRPNPVGGLLVEGQVLERELASFVGVLPIAQRHGMTIAEIAKFAVCSEGLKNVDLHIVPLKNWHRDEHALKLDFPWVNPSPNLPTKESAFTFCGTVLFEGTNISEGRGTTRSLEIIGHPQLNPYHFIKAIGPKLEELKNSDAFVLRPHTFFPMFQKHAQTPCGGLHIHLLRPAAFHSWELGQFLLRELSHFLGEHFCWQKGPYEYEHQYLPIDYINGHFELRKWVDTNGSMLELRAIAGPAFENFLHAREDQLIYTARGQR